MFCGDHSSYWMAKNHPFLLIKKKVLNGKKNLGSSTVLLYIKKASQVLSESFTPFSSNRGHRFKKRGFEKNAFKVSSMAYTC